MSRVPLKSPKPGMLLFEQVVTLNCQGLLFAGVNYKEISQMHKENFTQYPSQALVLASTQLYYSTIAPFYHIMAKERAKYATLSWLLHVEQGKNTD